MTGPLTIPPALQSVVVLVVGAAIVLGLATTLQHRPGFISLVGLTTVGLAALPALGADPTTRFAVVAVVVVAALALLLVPTAELAEESQRPEIAGLVLLGAVGAIVLATGNDLLQIAIGLETLSICSATLVALGRGERPLEAGFKYFILAGITFATLLYGVALVFLGTGSLAVPALEQVPAAGRWFVIAGLALMGVALAFKLALVPLHWGALDAYTAGAPGLVGYVMATSKLGAVVALARLAGAADQALGAVLVAVGLASIVWGVLGALAQHELRRLLAYSAVVHAGFLALALGSGPIGVDVALFYVVAYSAAALLAFLALASRGTEPLPLGNVSREQLDALRALGLALALLSLAGIPPTPGFWAKLAVLRVSWEALGLWPTLLAALGGVAGVLYYLRPLPDLLAATRSAGSPAPLVRPAVALGALVVLLLALVPGVAWSLAHLSG